MTDDFDEFFDDELAEAESVPEPASDNVAEADVRRPSAEPAALANSDPARSQRQSPPFWMVLAIAGISLALGVVIGYLVGTTVTINELSSREPEAASEDASVEMPEGHPDIELDDEGNAKVVDGSAAPVSNDPLTLANNFFDMGMSAMNGAKSEEDQLKARDVFKQAIADLEAFVARDATFAPAWANLGMFYESHGDADKAEKAYRKAVDTAAEDDTYGVGDYARERLEALSK